MIPSTNPDALNALIRDVLAQDVVVLIAPFSVDLPNWLVPLQAKFPRPNVVAPLTVISNNPETLRAIPRLFVVTNPWPEFFGAGSPSPPAFSCGL